MRERHGVLSFRPRIAEDWRRLRFRLTVWGSLLEVEIRPDLTVDALKEGEGISPFHHGAELSLSPGTPAVMAPPCAARSARPGAFAALFSLAAAMRAGCRRCGGNRHSSPYGGVAPPRAGSGMGDARTTSG